MKITDFFSHGSGQWLKYDTYEIKESNDGKLYVVPAETAKPSFYKPLENKEQLVADAVNIGLSAMHNMPEEELHADVLSFAERYGLLGLITALPTTVDFIEYEKVYLPKNHFLKEEEMETADYLTHFFPFRKPDFQKRGIESALNLTDRKEIAIAMTMDKEPRSVTMSFLRSYGELLDWILTCFRDLAFTITTSFLYYKDLDSLDDMEKDLYRQGMSAFGGYAPTYHIALGETKPVIVWEFHSLLRILQMLLSFMIADDVPAIKLCKKCGNAFLPTRNDNDFCSMRCKNQYNVYKTRARKKESE